MLKRLDKKLQGLPVLKDSLSYIPKMGLQINSYIKKQYTDIPIGTIFAIVGSVLYFVSPIDVIPDFLPVPGYIDDAGVVGIALLVAKSDIDEYMQWRIDQGLDIDFHLNA